MFSDGSSLTLGKKNIAKCELFNTKSGILGFSVIKPKR